MKRVLNAMAIIMAIVLSGIAAVISVMGLMTIFAGNRVWVMAVAGSLELAKVIVAAWLHNHWKQISFAFKTYLSTAVVILMLITSLGIYGFFAKAHIDQQLTLTQNESVLGLGKLETKLEMLTTTKNSLEEQEKQLSLQISRLSEALAPTVGTKQIQSVRIDTEKARKELAALRLDHFRVNKLKQETLMEISSLKAQKIGLSAETKKLEAEVGPIKYVAAWFSSNPGADQLEAAVQWMIFLLVITFDPMAVMLLMAASGTVKLKVVDTPKVTVETAPTPIPLKPEATISERHVRVLANKPRLKLLVDESKAAFQEPAPRPRKTRTRKPKKLPATAKKQKAKLRLIKSKLVAPKTVIKRIK